MITRFALFEGTLKDGKTEVFRSAVKDRLVPIWVKFAGNAGVSISFSNDRDEGAPEFPLILAISYPDVATMEAALASEARQRAVTVTGEIVAECFDGRIHHHITENTSYTA